MRRRIHEGQMLHSSLLHDKHPEETADSSQRRQSHLGAIGTVAAGRVVSERPYQPMTSLKYAHFLNIKDWDDFYRLRNTDSPLPSFVERDLNDLAAELVNGLRSDMPFATPHLLRQFASLTSSGEL